MGNFQYRGRDQGGTLVKGRLEAQSATAAATQLGASGLIPIDIVEVTAPRATLLETVRRLSARQPDLVDVILFTRQLYALVRAGVPINQAIAGLSRSSHNTVLAEALTDVQAQIESGRELSAGFARHPKIFTALFVAMVRVGENTGRVDEALLQISQYLELEKDTRTRVKSALRYPMMVLIAITVAIGIINVVVIPRFAQIFERAQVDLPLPTRILIGTSHVFVASWPFMIAAAVALLAGLRMWVNTEAGRLAWDRLKLKLPLVGNILMRATMGRFARSFAMALAAGVPLTTALAVVSRAVDNAHVGEKIASMRAGIERGDTLTRTAAGTGMFTPLVIQMLAVGEDTGSIDQLMAEIAGFYEREVDYDIKNLSQTIEPVLITVIAAMVLVLALGVFLPMWDMAAVKLRR